MVPDVYEIFELLEFHHILDVYDKVDEAVSKFETSEAAGQPVAKEITLPKSEPVKEEESDFQIPTKEDKGVVQEQTQQVEIADMAIADRVRHMVEEDPEFGSLKIKRELNSARYGYTKIGWFAVRSELAKLKLNNRSKRYQYATSA